MQKISLAPFREDLLPTRRTLPKEWKLDSLEQAFYAEIIDSLPEVILFESDKGMLVADGNHRILLGMKHNKELKGIIVERGEHFTLQGKPTLNYGKHTSYEYGNSGVYLSYILYCRTIAQMKGFGNFKSLYEKSVEQKILKP